MTRRHRQQRNNRRRQRRKSSLSLGQILAVAALALVAVGAWQMLARDKRSSDTPGPDITHGCMTCVKADSTLESLMVDYPGMTLSFNPSKHIPNWAAWELTADMVNTGKHPRENKFYCDEAVDGCPESYDYSYSGYDRGHMVPAGDMKWSKEAMHATFSLVNICPQAKTLNTGTWKSLEEKCRQWALADSAIVIICGPVMTDNITEYIGDSRVAVPKRFFKVILSPHARPARGIGFIMPNGKVPGGMQAAAVSIDEVERVTGLDFFSALPDDIEQEVERQCDFHYWSTLRK